MMYQFPMRSVAITRDFVSYPTFGAVRGTSVAAPAGNHITSFTGFMRDIALHVFGNSSTSRSFQAAVQRSLRTLRGTPRGSARPTHMSSLPFTDDSIQVIKFAEEEARGSGYIVGTEQLLLGLIGADIGIAAEVLKSAGINLEIARQRVERIIGRNLPSEAPSVPRTRRAQEVLDRSSEEARELGTWLSQQLYRFCSQLKSI